MADQIVIEDLELLCHVGVLDEERAAPQRLTVSLILFVLRDFAVLRDDIRSAVDYQRVCQSLQALAGVRPRRLIETLASEMADEVLAHFAVATVELHLRKFVLPETASVGVRLRRDRLPR